MDNSRTKRVDSDRYKDAAADLAVQGGIQDYLQFLTVADVAKAVGVAKNAVTNRCGTKEQLVELALDHALWRANFASTRETAQMLSAAGDGLQQGDWAALFQIAEAAAHELLAYDASTAQQTDTATWIAVAAAAQDPVAREFLSKCYDKLTEVYIPLYDKLARNSGRRFTAAMPVEDFTVAMTALTDGFLARRRFDPASAPETLFARLAIGLFEMATVDAGASSDVGIGDRLIPVGTDFDQGDRDVLVGVARNLYNARDRWDDVTFTAIAEAAQVERTAVVANFGDISVVAASIWAQWIPVLRKELGEDTKRFGIEQVLTHHIERLADYVVRNRPLTGSMLGGFWSHSVKHGPPRYEDPFDPRTVAPVPSTITTLLMHHKGNFRPGYVTTKKDAAVFSAFLHNAALHTAIARGRYQGAQTREMSTSDIARYVIDVVLNGAVARRPRASGAGR